MRAVNSRNRLNSIIFTRMPTHLHLLNRACKRSVSGLFVAQCSSLFLWHPLFAPRPPTPRSAPAGAFSGMSAHRSAPVHSISPPLRSVFRSAHAPLIQCPVTKPKRFCGSKET